jgi:hypothetical protein
MIHRFARRPRARYAAAALAVVVLVLGVVAGRPSAAADVYEVKGVAVDVTSETVTKARDEAIAQAHEMAFRRLLERLTLQADRDRLPRPRAPEIAGLVHDFSVAQEKTSSKRYIGRLDFRFKREDVRSLLVDFGLSFAETLSKPVLVLPVYESAGALLLWDTPNPWREAWEAVPNADGLVPLVLPLGDLSDIAAIGAEQAVKGDVQRLTEIAGRYGAEDALVARATLRLDPQTGRPELSVSATRQGADAPEQTLVRSFAAAADEEVDGLLRRAALEVAMQVEDDWKRDNLLQFGQQGVLSVSVPITRLDDWLTVRDRLAGIAVVRYAELVLLSRSQVLLNLHYLGAPEQLGLALAQADLALAREDDVWTLKPRGGATAGGAL